MRKANLNILLFLAVIFGFAAVNLLMPKTDTVSTLEQRNIQPLPEYSAHRLFKGEYTREFDNYFADNFMFRTPIIQAGAQFKRLKGVPSDAAIIVGNEGETKYLIVADRAYTAYRYSEDASRQYADAVNRFAAGVDPSVRIFMLMAPTSVEFMNLTGYQSMTDSQQDAMALIGGMLSSSIRQVDAYNALAQHSDEYVYFRTDHHWTALGAYYAYRAFMESIGEEPVDLSQYESRQIPDFLGTSYKFTLHEKLRDKPDTLVYYIPFIPYEYRMYANSGKVYDRKVVNEAYAAAGSSAYLAFLGGDYPLGEIRTDNRNGKTLAVIKDSYANAFIPFLLPHYETIYYIDPRHYQSNLLIFMREKHVTDVLFLNNIKITDAQYLHNLKATGQAGIAQMLNGLMDEQAK